MMIVKILSITSTPKTLFFPELHFYLFFFFTINLLIGEQCLSSHICVRNWKRSIFWQTYKWKTSIKWLFSRDAKPKRKFFISVCMAGRLKYSYLELRYPSERTVYLVAQLFLAVNDRLRSYDTFQQMFYLCICFRIVHYALLSINYCINMLIDSLYTSI